MSDNYIQPFWPAPDFIKAYTSTRHLQNRKPITAFDFFNLGDHVQDDPAIVSKNRQQLVAELQLPEMPTWFNQVHGGTVAELKDNTLSGLAVDACYTRLPNKVCAMLTADCLPVLLFHPERDAVAAIHGGWRSLYADIIVNTVSALDLPAAELYAWLGPAISGAHYTVGDDFRNKFLEKSGDYQSAFYVEEADWHCDLYQIAKIQLNQLGISHIYGGTYCTFRQDDLFYSYRRDGARSGRQITLIWINR